MQTFAHGKKSRSPKAPAVQLVVCPDKNQKSASVGKGALASPPVEPAYALRRGRTVKSRTCARMLDICIPLSCVTNGNTSATN